MRRVWSADGLRPRRAFDCTSTGSRNDQVRARRSEPSLQIHDHSDGGQPLRLPVDVGIERDELASFVAGIPGAGADRLRRKTQLPDRRSKLPMVAFYRAHVLTRQLVSPAGE